jgi:ATP-dependent Clp protease ATP-binding subunit ClpA
MSKKVAQEYGIEKFDISDEVISDIAKEAMNSGMGARDAYNLITDRIDALMFDTGEIPATV